MYTRNDKLNEIRSDFKMLKNACNRTNLYVAFIGNEKIDVQRIKEELFAIIVFALEIEEKLSEIMNKKL